MKIDSHLIDGNMSLTHMAIYAVMGFPLFLKGPLTHITETKAKILKDPILHSIHQDALGEAGYRIPGHFYNGIQIYVRRLVKGRIVGEHCGCRGSGAIWGTGNSGQSHTASSWLGRVAQF